MRLIDADDFKKQIAAAAFKYNYSADKVNAVFKLIDIQPTAYDIDGVVEQLEELSAEHPYKAPGEPDTYSQYNEAWEGGAK